MSIFTTDRHPVFEKTDDDVLTYTHRAERFLDGDTISTSTWETDLTVDSSAISVDTKSATATISGGTAGGKYKVTNKIVTAAGSTKEAWFYLKITDGDSTGDY